jgi:hypothetical protein
LLQDVTVDSGAELCGQFSNHSRILAVKAGIVKTHIQSKAGSRPFKKWVTLLRLLRVDDVLNTS